MNEPDKGNLEGSESSEKSCRILQVAPRLSDFLLKLLGSMKPYVFKMGGSFLVSFGPFLILDPRSSRPATP